MSRTEEKLMENENVSNKGIYQKITRRDLRKVFWRLQIFGLGISMNPVTAQAISFCSAMIPALKKLYKDADVETRARAMKRHLLYFLSQNTATGMILGITTAIEETTDEDEKEAVVAIKAGMMGPLAGIGDSVFKITIQAIAGSIGAAYALQGSILGPILMFLVYNSINMGVKYYGLVMGYEKGIDYIQSGDQAKLMQKIVNIATMVGVIVLGALIAQYVQIEVGAEIVTGDTVVNVQELLDGVIPKLLPLLFTLGLYRLHKYLPRKHLIWLIFGTLAVGTILAVYGIII